jgi:hypothetical protein
MTSLLDIGPLTEEVSVKGVKLTVSGISAIDIFNLIRRFSEIRNLIEGKEATSAEGVMTMAPDAVAAMIAACTGTPGNPEAEMKAKQLGVGDQLAIIEPALRMTFREGGIGPFVEQIQAITKLIGVVAATGELATSSPEASSGALQRDMPPGTSGPTRLDK